MNKITEKIEFRLGEILVAFDFVTEQELNKSLRFSSLTGLPLGKALTYLEYLQNHFLHDALEAQSLLRENLISVEEARAALFLSQMGNIGFSEALYLLEIRVSNTSCRLGEILKDAAKINQDQLKTGLQISDISGFPLGKVLVMLKIISEDYLQVALTLQRQLRIGEISKFSAISTLREARPDTVNKTQLSVSDSAVAEQKMRIGDLLLKSGCIESENLFLALENQKGYNKLIGQYLVDSGTINSEILELALRLQMLAVNGKISHSRAVEILREAKVFTVRYQTCFQNEMPFFNFTSFLTVGNYLTVSRKREMLQKVFNTPSLLSVILKSMDTQNPTGQRTSARVVAQNIFRCDALLLIVTLETYYQDKNLIETAYNSYKQVKSHRIGLSEAIISLILKEQGFESGLKKVA